MEGLNASDVALLQDRNYDGFGSGLGFFWIFALLMLNNGGFGNNNRNYVTDADLAISQNAQTNQLQMSGLAEQIAQNKFDIAQAINDQTAQLQNQSYANQINAVQGFNNISSQITNQTNQLSSQLMQLGAKMDSCCCEIKTQMLQNRLDEAERRNIVLQNSIDNANQSQYILGQLGRFVAWAGSGSQSTTAG